jgi:hypothetical protein
MQITEEEDKKVLSSGNTSEERQDEQGKDNTLMMHQSHRIVDQSQLITEKDSPTFVREEIEDTRPQIIIEKSEDLEDENIINNQESVASIDNILKPRNESKI